MQNLFMKKFNFPLEKDTNKVNLHTLKFECKL